MTQTFMYGLFVCALICLYVCLSTYLCACEWFFIIIVLSRFPLIMYTKNFQISVVCRQDIKAFFMWYKATAEYRINWVIEIDHKNNQTVKINHIFLMRVYCLSLKMYILFSFFGLDIERLGFG